MAYKNAFTFVVKCQMFTLPKHFKNSFASDIKYKFIKIITNARQCLFIKKIKNRSFAYICYISVKTYNAYETRNFKIMQ